jgi:hypothetical protein
VLLIKYFKIINLPLWLECPLYFCLKRKDVKKFPNKGKQNSEKRVCFASFRIKAKSWFTSEKVNPFFTMTTFLTYFMDSKRSKCGSGILEFHFFVFQNFDCKPRYAWFSIFLCLNVAFLFLHLSLSYFFLNNALGLLNPNLVKFLRYLYPFLRYLKKSLFFSNSVFYSACALFKTMQLFSTSLAIKFDPDEIETFCFFLLLKAEIHAILAQKL